MTFKRRAASLAAAAMGLVAWITAASGGEAPRIRWLGRPDNSRADLGFYHIRNIDETELYHASPEQGCYSHHAYVIEHHGVLYAAWSNNLRDEDAPGQRVVMRRLPADSDRWTLLQEALPPIDTPSLASEDGRGRRTMCANGFAKAEDRLYVLSECWRHGAGYRGPDAGLGRLCREVKPDGRLGPLFWLREAPPKPLPGFDAYPGSDDPRFRDIAAKINAYLAQPEHFPSWEFLRQATRPLAADGHQLCEPTYAWRLPNGAYARFWRDLGRPRSFCNYVSLSRDAGRTWIDAEPTQFPDGCSRSAAGVLPDGTVFVINNIRRGPAGGYPSRVPLAVSLARDGLTFDRIGIIAYAAPPRRCEGRAKGPGFQYPNAVVARGRLWVVYSVNKEDIRVSGIPLAELDKIPRCGGPDAADPARRADPD